MRKLAIVNLALSTAAVAAPVAHLLEMPNKFALDGPLWLAIQQNLYRGWGPLLGAPAEIGALLTSAVLAWRAADAATARRLWVACLGYAAMLAAYFLLNAPVNAALSTWSPATLPPDWAQYRLRWELGHALAALFSIVSLVALLRASAWRASGQVRPGGKT